MLLERAYVIEFIMLSVSVAYSARQFEGCAMSSVIGPQWVTGKLAFFTIAWNTFDRRFSNDLRVCSIFCKFKLGTLYGDFALCRSLQKSVFNSFVRKLKL